MSKARSLRNDLIRLAHGNPEFQPKLLPLLMKQGAEEITLQDLPPAHLRLAKAVGRPEAAWEGIHGIIVEFAPDAVGGFQLNQRQLKKLVSPLVRWVGATRRGNLSIGMVGR